MALPEEFVALMKSYGSEQLALLPEALTGEPSTAVRLNRRKTNDSDAAAMPGRRVAWCPQGRHLDSRPAFTFDPAMHQGRYYVQDASSMFISHVVRHLTVGSAGPLRVLDACAAPGGKTTAIIDALPDGSLVVANEFVRERAAVLRENLAKWGYPDVAVTQGDTARFSSLGPTFDIVAVDAPCSGEGMMRKDSDAVGQWTPRLVEQCAALQREILDNVWPSLRPGGYLIYSTCTFNRAEDECMAEYLRDVLGAVPVHIPVGSDWGIVAAVCSDIPAYRFLPGRIEGEGLFITVVRKPLDGQSSQPEPRPKAAKKKKDRHADTRQRRAEIPESVKRWISRQAEWTLDGDRLIASLPGITDEIRPEITVATLKGRDFIPSQQLAMSLALSPGAFPAVEVDRPTAIDYLRCEAVRLTDGAPRGIVLLTYGGLPLGFVKNLGNRANNLYPKPWRILSARPADLPPALL